MDLQFYNVVGSCIRHDQDPIQQFHLPTSIRLHHRSLISSEDIYTEIDIHHLYSKPTFMAQQSQTAE